MDSTNSTNSSGASVNATAATGATGATGTDADAPYLNPTSRLHRYVCKCEQHIINEATGATRPGPYIMRVAGTGLLATCFYCGEFFRLEDAPPTRRLYRGCKHCNNPEAHTHGAVDEDGNVIASDEDGDADGDSD